ncbi:MAG TPA: glycoside hydrolase family 27 protein [Bacteroidales bacterium]|nr:glycoside hydrolase family 27 protein [Bacteroidales bacterium]
MKSKLTIILLLIISTGLHGQKFDGLALTPPMGWNSWNHFGCNVDEKMIRETADAMVTSGMRDAGYTYVVIDDCWHGQRDSLGFIQPDPERFPSGMKALADYIHAKGLKFGIYSDAGTRTCAGRPGSRGYEYQDALTYASWGVDYLKYDWCSTDSLNAREAYKTMRDALYHAKRPVVLSICEWGDNEPWTWAQDIGHLWRISGDIHHCFDCQWDHGMWSSWGVVQILEMRKNIRKYTGPDHWNDFDMMEVGNGMSVSEDRAHFSLWCMVASPLMTGNDLRKMTKETIDILTNKEVIAINQDPLGIQGYKMLDFGDLEIWVKPLQDSALAVCFLNRALTPQSVEFDWKKYRIDDGLSKLQLDFNATTYQVRDLWVKKPAGTTDQKFKVVLPGHDVIMLKLYK